MEKKTGLLAALGTALLVPVSVVHAELPAVIGTSLTAAKGDFDDLYELALPVMIAIAAAMLVWRYGKRFIGKL